MYENELYFIRGSDIWNIGGNIFLYLGWDKVSRFVFGEREQ